MLVYCLGCTVLAALLATPVVVESSDHTLGNEALDAPLHGRRRQPDLLAQHFGRQRSVVLQCRENRPILVVKVLHKIPC